MLRPPIWDLHLYMHDIVEVHKVGIPCGCLQSIMLRAPMWDLDLFLPVGVHSVRVYSVGVYSVGVYSAGVYNAWATDLGPGKPLIRSFRRKYRGP